VLSSCVTRVSHPTTGACVQKEIAQRGDVGVDQDFESSQKYWSLERSSRLGGSSERPSSAPSGLWDGQSGVGCWLLVPLNSCR
jgi:hypothetical protein